MTLTDREIAAEAAEELELLSHGELTVEVSDALEDLIVKFLEGESCDSATVRRAAELLAPVALEGESLFDAVLPLC